MSKPTDLRRLGTILVLGVIAGYGVRYVASRVNRRAADGPTGLIDWEQARTFALRVSQWEQAGIPNRAMRRDDWKLVARNTQPWELYDLSMDRVEQNNLAAEHPERVKEMALLHDAWMRRANVMDWTRLNRMQQQRRVLG